jgi:serine protease
MIRFGLGRNTDRLIHQRLSQRSNESQTERRMSARQRLKYRTLLAAKQLPKDPDIDGVEPNLLLQPTREPDDSLYPLQWHLPEINLPGAWDLTTGGGPNDVIVAVVDTGILSGHPDLIGQLVNGYDFVLDASRARDGDGIDDDPEDPGDFAYGSGRSSFHGTHVAGTVAARSDNGEGVAGVSWDAKLMPMRALAVDGGTTYDVIQAVRYAAGLSSDAPEGPPAQPADIINLSLGSPFFSASAQATIDEVRAAGVIVIASAGNESSAAPSYPAAYNGVVSVSATTIDGSIARYSNFGAVDVAAPGGYNATDLNGDGFADGVVSTLGEDSTGTIQLGYGAMNGTSMAAPHVAGVAALMKAVHPGLTPTEFDNALAAGDLTDDLGAPGYDQFYGFGLINAQKAVLAALSLAGGAGSDPGPILGSSLNQVNFGVLSTTQRVVLSNLGTGSITIQQPPVTSEAWLTVNPIPPNPSGLGEYELVVDRSGLAEGPHNANVRFDPVDTNTNSVTISVTIQVQLPGTNPDADAGLFYLVIVDDSNTTVGGVGGLTAANGVYTFTMTDVPPGIYRLFAGSDMDDDNFLCDAGEACGSFRTLDAPELVIVDPQSNPSVTDLDFVSEFRAVITTLGTAAESAGGVDGGIALPESLAR